MLGIAFYGALAAVAVWECVAEFRPSRLPTLLRWGNNVAIGILGYAAERWLVTATGLSLLLYAGPGESGMLAQLDLPPPVACVLSVLLLDMLFYWLHRCWHAVPFLWRIHTVHHSDTELDFTVALRRHPVELFINVFVAVPVIFWLGVPLEAVLAFQALRSASLIVEHGNVRLPDGLDRWLRYVVVTPNMHQVHHSAAQPETDSNFSDLFPVWDRLFGTYRERPAAGPEAVTIGLAEFREPRDVWLDRMLLQPFRVKALRPSPAID